MAIKVAVSRINVRRLTPYFVGPRESPNTELDQLESRLFLTPPEKRTKSLIWRKTSGFEA